ncbi:MAG: ADP-ribosyltransferase, partial [Bacilli bacterium]
IQDIEKARLLKLAKSGNTDGSTIDLFATKDEKLELARLQDIYDNSLKSTGSHLDFNTRSAYDNLADYKKSLAEKYVSHQGILTKLNGETAEMQKQALKDYLGMSPDSSANTQVGGHYEKLCSSDTKKKIKEWSKKIGVPEDELGLVARYTAGSKWCNRWGYNVADSFYGKVMDYGGRVQKFYPALNGILEKLPRYNGITFSGIDMDLMNREKLIKTMQECVKTGKPFTNTAFLSSSTKISTAHGFGDDIIYVIKGKKGVDVRPVSCYQNEDEVIFRHHTKFKVEKVYQEKKQCYGRTDSWIIELEEI